MSLHSWLQRTDWMWKVIGGSFLLAYLHWYIPTLRQLPGSIVDPPEARLPYARHWTLDFVMTALAGIILLYLGLKTAIDLTKVPTEMDEDI